MQLLQQTLPPMLGTTLPETVFGTVVAVSLSPFHRFSKQPQPSIQLLAGLGVEGDAHCGATVQHLYLKRKNASAPNRMQVHLFSSELLEEVNEKGFHVGPGDLGENILTCGLDLTGLPAGTRLSLGADAAVELTCLRQPCRQIDIFRTGLQKQMHATAQGGPQYRAGVMAVVLRSGLVRAGDPVQVEFPAPPMRFLTV